MRKVGKDIVINKKTNKKRKFSYTDVKYDDEKWADASEYLPADFDLVFLRIQDKPITSGWINGIKWEGLKVIEADKVLYWKKRKENDEEKEW